MMNYFSFHKYLKFRFSYCCRVLVLFMPYFWYFRNSNELLGTYKNIVKTLTAMSYTVVTINENMWINLPKERRTPFLMNEIQSKLRVVP